MSLVEAQRSRQAAPEQLLLELAERLERFRDDRVAVHIHLSRLQAQHRREHHLRVATATFEGAVRQIEGHIFVLRNSDIVFVSRERYKEVIEQAVTRMRFLFSEDPLMALGDGEEVQGFCSWYHLARNYPEFYASCDRMLATADAAQPIDAPPPQRKVPLDPATLGKLEDSLSRADLSNLIRNQPVCTLDERGLPRPVFYELYVSISDLEKLLAPGTNLTSDKWLFQHLTGVLDGRMLSHLARDPDRRDRSFSINLNVATLLSTEFQRFDQSVNSSLRGKLVIELQKHDIFADMGAYVFARDFVRERGYRICLDGITHLTLPFIDRERLGLDLLKMYWSSELDFREKPQQLAEIRAQVAAIGTSRVVMAHVDSAAAMHIGKAIGISAYQGRLIDRMLLEMSKSTPTAGRK